MRPTDFMRRVPGTQYAHGDSHGGHGHDDRHNDDTAHEESDINVRALLWSAVVLAVVCIGTGVLMYGLFWQLEKQAAARDPKLSPLAMPQTVMPPTTITSPEFGGAPEPRLLTNEPLYLSEQRKREHDQLDGYGWVDEKAGVARIAIDHAKELLIQRGLPVRAEGPADARLGTYAPAHGESSSGRTVTKPVGPATEQQSAPPPAAPAATHKSGH